VLNAEMRCPFKAWATPLDGFSIFITLEPEIHWHLKSQQVPRSMLSACPAMRPQPWFLNAVGASSYGVSEYKLAEIAGIELDARPVQAFVTV